MSVITNGLDNNAHVFTTGVGGTVTAGNASLTVSSGDLTISGTGGGAGGNLNLPDTASAAVGVVNVGGVPFMHKYGSYRNTFVGQNAGNFTTTQIANTAVGNLALHAVTGTGNSNNAFGDFTLSSLTTGGSNTGCGGQTLFQLTTGSNNTAIGKSAGQSYTGSESSNICIGSSVYGTVGESNVMRLGNGTGTGTGQIETAIVSGVYGITPAVSGTNQMVISNDQGQLGTQAIPGTGAQFSAYVSTDLTNVSGNNVNYDLICDTVVFDSASAYNNTNGHYVVPSTGVYVFGGSWWLSNLGAGHTIFEGSLYQGGTFYWTGYDVPYTIAGGGLYLANWTQIVNCTVGDVMQPHFLVQGSTQTVGLKGNSTGGIGTQFWGYRIA